MKLHLVLSTLLMAFGLFAQAQSGALRAGVARVDISPTPEMFPLKAGQTYGGLHDPVFARALVLDNGKSKVALLTVDTTGIPFGTEVIQAVTAELKIPAANLLLSATHDHNSPLGGSGVKTPYFELVKKGIVAAARQANAALQPARIGFGTGKAYVNTNRDQFIVNGYHMGYVPDGASDKTVAVLTVTKPGGEILATYANYPVHSVVMYRTHTSKDGQIEVTGDLAGYTAHYVEEHFPGSVALWTMGAAGDQNPLFMANYNQDAPDVFDEGPGGFAILDVQARRLGEEIVRVARATQNTTGSALLWGAEVAPSCPGRQRAEPAAPGTAPGGYQAPAQVKMIDGDPVAIPLHLVMINDIALAGVSAEVFTEIGQHTKEQSLFDRTLMVTNLPNGVGYIPTDLAFTYPAEKALANRLKPGCAEPAMIDGFRKLQSEYLPLWKATVK